MISFVVFNQVYAQTFTAIPLTHPDGKFRAVDLNNLAQIAGTVYVNDTTYHAVLREQDGQFTPLPELGGNLSESFAMNEWGDVLGITIDGQGAAHIMVWDSAGSRELEVPAEAAQAPVPTDINNVGVATGFYTDSENNTHAVIWDTNGNVYNLPEGNGQQSSPAALNDSGDVVGTVWMPDGTPRAILWQPNGSTKSVSSFQVADYSFFDIGTLGGTGAQATDINNYKQIVGFSNFSPDSIHVHAFIWQDTDSIMIDLGTLGGHNSYANSINDDGYIVGRSEVKDTVSTKSDRSLVPPNNPGKVSENHTGDMKPFSVYVGGSTGFDVVVTHFHWDDSRFDNMEDGWGVNSDVGVLARDDEDNNYFLNGNLAFFKIDATGGNLGYSWSPFGSREEAINADPDVYPSAMLWQGGVYSVDQNIGMGITDFNATWEGYGPSRKNNPDNTTVVFYGPYYIAPGGKGIFSGGLNNTWIHDEEVRVDGHYIAKGNNHLFREKVTVGSEAIMKFKTTKDDIQLVVADKGFDGEGTVSIKGSGTTQFNGAGDFRATFKVEKEPNTNVVVNAPNATFYDFYLITGHLVALDNMYFSPTARIYLSEQESRVRELKDSWLITYNPYPNAIVGGNMYSYMRLGFQRPNLKEGIYEYPLGNFLSYNPLSLIYHQDLLTEVTTRVKFDTWDNPPAFDGVWGPSQELERQIFLDKVAPPYWRMHIDKLPSVNPDIRVNPNSLQDVFNPYAFSLAAFDMDLKFLGLLGSDPATRQSEIIDNSLVLTHSNVILDTAWYIAMITNSHLNPPSDGQSYVGIQFIDAIGDDFISDFKINDHFMRMETGYQEGTPFMFLEAGNTQIDIMNASSQNNTDPIFSTSANFLSGRNYILAFTSQESVIDYAIFDMARIKASDPDKVDLNVYNGYPGFNSVEYRVDVEGEPPSQAHNLDYNSIGEYVSRSPGKILISFLDRTSFFDLTDYKGESLTAILAPDINFKKSEQKADDTDYDLVLIDALGRMIEPTKVVATSVGELIQLPGEFALQANYPNPFKHKTRIDYQIPRETYVRLTISNILGQTIRNLLEAQRAAGQHSIEWDGLDDSGSMMSPGIYMIRMEAGEFVQTRTMMMVE